MTHRILGCRVALVVTGALLLGALTGLSPVAATTAAPAPAADRPTTFTIGAGPFIRGEGIPVSGTVPGSNRYVRFQVKKGKAGDGRWTFRGAVRSDARGRWNGTFVTPRTAPGQYRFRVVPGKSGGRDASPVRVRRTVDQTADLTLESEVAPTGGQSHLTATFTPARPGRGVAFQERVDGSWQRLAASEQWYNGKAGLTLEDLADGTRTFRALAYHQPYVKAVFTPERTLSVVPPYVTRVSSTPGGVAAGGGDPSISDDGTRIAFVSEADPVGDGDRGVHVYVHDTTTGETERASVSSDGVAGDGRSVSPSISGDGTRVGFVSNATTLVDGVEPGPSGTVKDHVYLRDLEAGTTELVDVGPDGTRGNGPSEAVSLNRDGTRIAYVTISDNLPPPAGPDAIVPRQVYVRDTEANTLVSATVNREGGASLGNAEDPSIDADGERVAFSSEATDLVAGDANDRRDVFVTDLAAGTTTLASVSSAGDQGGRDSEDPSLSDDGTRVVFTSGSRDLVSGDGVRDLDVFLHDTATGRTSMPSRLPVEQKDFTGSPSISGDGRFVVFSSLDSRFVPGDESRTQDVFVRDTADGSIRRVSTDLDGTSGNNGSFTGAPDADGDRIAFASTSTWDLPSDEGLTTDVFVADMDRYPRS